MSDTLALTNCKWEVIAEYTERLPVYGGWIVQTFVYGRYKSQSMVFVPDPEHRWEIVKE
jgi:hypothetical protein